MDRKEKAAEMYSNSLNCAQSVIGAFEDKLGNQCNILMEAASGFGGGMGKLQKTCGAITGSIMIMSVLNYKNMPNSKEKLEKNIQELVKRFEKKFGATDCLDIITYNLNTESGKEKAKQEKIFERKCTKVVSQTVEWVSEIIDTEEIK
ncbi:MAG: C-GCAxxG-C-C family protein [Bacteroidales bacterium]